MLQKYTHTRYITNLIYINSIIGQVFAQTSEKHGFSGYADFVLKGYDIICKMPDKFIDLKWKIEPFIIREGGRVGYFYYPIIQSTNKECILMYPFSPLYDSFTKSKIKYPKLVGEGREALFARNQMVAEIKTALGLTGEGGSVLKDATFDMDKYVTLLSGKEAKKRFNADTVFIFQIPLEKPYKEKYLYCTGMTLYKKDSPVMYFKWFFTEEGKKNEKKYLNMLSKKVWYGNKKCYFNETIEEDYLQAPGK